jgi:ribosome assembly protein YihI (activator of Der GTPase)
MRSIGMETSSERSSDTQIHGKRKTLTVRRPVYEAVRDLRWKAKAKGGPAPSRAATENVTKSLANGNKKAARFWSEVHLFLVAHNHVGRPLRITDDPID